MKKKLIYFIYMPSPMFGRFPLQGVVGSGFLGRLFGLYTEDSYIDKLQKDLSKHFPDWSVRRDDTESDIERIIEKEVSILVCAPGLKYQFYYNGFEKMNIIYLSMMEYANNITKPVVNKVKEIENEMLA